MVLKFLEKELEKVTKYIIKNHEPSYYNIIVSSLANTSYNDK